MKVLFSATICAGLLLAMLNAQSKEPAAENSSSGEEPASDQIIQKFAEKEAEFYKAWLKYTFRQTAIIRILSVDGSPSKESITLVSEVVIDDDGERDIKILRRSGNLRSVAFTKEDLAMIENRNPFPLRTEMLPSYTIKYQGKEKVDELDCYVFSAKPKKMNKGETYFEGKVWVDDRNLIVVRSIGKIMPQTKGGQFPEFETIRQFVDGQYWFPIWMHADSRLRFPGSIIRVDETVTYERYENTTAKAPILIAPQ